MIVKEASPSELGHRVKKQNPYSNSSTRTRHHQNQGGSAILIASHSRNKSHNGAGKQLKESSFTSSKSRL